MLKGKKVILRPVDIKKDLENFWRWINDLELNQFLGRLFKPITLEKEKEQLQRITSDEKSMVFSIDTVDGKHIGITGLHNINHFDGTAVTGTFIGDKNYWGKGYGTDAKMLLLWYAFNVLNLRRVNSRVAAYNKRSLKCQLKCGYKIEGVMKKELYKNGCYYDLITLAVFRRGWFKLWRAYISSEKIQDKPQKINKERDANPEIDQLEKTIQGWKNNALIRGAISVKKGG